MLDQFQQVAVACMISNKLQQNDEYGHVLKAPAIYLISSCCEEVDQVDSCKTCLDDFGQCTVDPLM